VRAAFFAAAERERDVAMSDTPGDDENCGIVYGFRGARAITSSSRACIRRKWRGLARLG